VLDVDEGSKKGLVKVLEEICERMTLKVEEWAGKTRMILGDWLTSNNLRAARRDRADDINSMERLEYAEELSMQQLYALALRPPKHSYDYVNAPWEQCLGSYIPLRT
jgi:hypothetical protein